MNDNRTALIVVDVQQGLEDAAYWGNRDNLDADANIAALISAWSDREWPIVYVQHNSTRSVSPLRPGQPGNDLKAYLSTTNPDLHVTKTVNSAFHGTPDLHAWLQENGLSRIAICGITTNHCCETTARVGGNLGYDVAFVLDATHTFDLAAPDGTVIPAAMVAQVTAANLNGEFATIVATDDLLD